ncbi:MAG: Asp-tRNA(Asn)/Glu-tRNA(Gln) amidotransferase subunit GatA [Chitinophagaceae bacterium]|nr:Asp-tRNA(Asn)/Glu-tRNA(Gln) amidotransferase subunit GatA [Chitinophagaceae bacterium]
MFRFTSIKDYHAALVADHTTCTQAVKYYLDQIAAHENLNAYLEVFSKEALEQAAILDAERNQGKRVGKLHGVVIGIKDVLSYKGHKLSAASKILENYTAVYTATAIQKLVDEGAIIIGRQNCDEFAMGSSNENSAYGPVKNAIDSSKVPGGSSGGSAVSVQANLSMISIGSDTGGSVRQPADFCGVVGLKPSYGRISRYGLIAYASSFDQIGIFSKTIDDAALVLEVMAGKDEFDSTVSSKPVPAYSKLIESKLIEGKEIEITASPKRIAYFKETLFHPGLDPEIKTKIESYLKDLTAKGYIVEAIDFSLLSYLVPTYYVLTAAEASSNLSRFDGIKFGHRTKESIADLNELYKKTRTEGFGEEVQRRILLGSFVLSAGYFDAYFTKAQQVRQKLVDLTSTVFSKYDLILSPTVPTTAFGLGENNHSATEMFLADIYTVYANLVGIPAISIPLFTHSNGMPFGLQVMSASFNEVGLLSFSKEQMLNKV